MKHKILSESTFDPANQEWTHNPCGTVLMGKQVVYSIHDGPFPLSGSGEVHTETVPYCPKCQPEPSSTGILRQNPKDVSDAAILRRMREGYHPSR